MDNVTQPDLFDLPEKHYHKASPHGAFSQEYQVFKSLRRLWVVVVSDLEGTLPQREMAFPFEGSAFTLQAEPAYGPGGWSLCWRDVAFTWQRRNALRSLSITRKLSEEERVALVLESTLSILSLTQEALFMEDASTV